MKWVIVFLYTLSGGQQMEAVNTLNGPWQTQAQCERWVREQRADLEKAIDAFIPNDPRFTKEAVVGCAQIGDM